jgi:hypothetical protein
MYEHRIRRCETKFDCPIVSNGASQPNDSVDLSPGQSGWVKMYPAWPTA